MFTERWSCEHGIDTSTSDVSGGVDAPRLPHPSPFTAHKPLSCGLRHYTRGLRHVRGVPTRRCQDAACVSFTPVTSVHQERRMHQLRRAVSMLAPSLRPPRVTLLPVVHLPMQPAVWARGFASQGAGVPTPSTKPISGGVSHASPRR